MNFETVKTIIKQELGVILEEEGKWETKSRLKAYVRESWRYPTWVISLEYTGKSTQIEITKYLIKNEKQLMRFINKFNKMRKVR